MKPAPLALAAINKAIETAQEDSRRLHLGASVMGRPCEREIWYGWRWALRFFHRGQLLRLFGRGHKEEPNVMAALRSIGCKVWELDPSTGKQWRAGPWHGGHFGGSADAIAVGLPDLPPKTPFLVSVKTHNDKSFTGLREMGVMGAKFEHFVQEQTYLKQFQPPPHVIEWCLYVGVNKNDDNWHLELVHFDAAVAETVHTRAGNVIYANQPPKRIANSPGSYHCKFCDFNKLCHFGEGQVDRNCRTCRFSRPADNSLWQCGLRNVPLDEAAQKAACGSYQMHPDLDGPQP